MHHLRPRAPRHRVTRATRATRGVTPDTRLAWARVIVARQVAR